MLFPYPLMYSASWDPRNWSVWLRDDHVSGHTHDEDDDAREEDDEGYLLELSVTSSLSLKTAESHTHCQAGNHVR